MTGRPSTWRPDKRPNSRVSDNASVLPRGELVRETVDLGACSLDILRPPDAEALISEEAFEREEFLPYWAELWPSGIALARHLAGHAESLRGTRVLELGCGLALPSIVAARSGAAVVATDWSSDALQLLEENAARNDAPLEILEARWTDHEPFAARAPFDLVLAADVLYERRNAEEILALLPVVLASGSLLLADPGRPQMRGFLSAAEELGYETSVLALDGDALPRGAMYQLRKSELPARR